MYLQKALRRHRRMYLQKAPGRHRQAILRIAERKKRLPKVRQTTPTGRIPPNQRSPRPGIPVTGDRTDYNRMKLLQAKYTCSSFRM